MTGEEVEDHIKSLGHEPRHDVNALAEAINEAIKLSVKYQPDRKLPDKAIDLIDLACSRFNLKTIEEKTVGENEIQFELSKVIKLPAEQIAENSPRLCPATASALMSFFLRILSRIIE